jgi:hypothetical protein
MLRPIYRVKLNFGHGPAQPLMQSSAQVPSKKDANAPLMNEIYDELVFTSPTEKFKRLLSTYNLPISKVEAESKPAPGPLTDYYTIFDDEKDTTVLTAIQAHLTTQIDSAKWRLRQLDTEIGLLRSEGPPHG